MKYILQLQIEELVKSIKRGYIDIIGKTNWMERSTQEFLQDKIQSIKTFIAYPHWIKDDKKLLEFFSGVKLRFLLHHG